MPYEIRYKFKNGSQTSLSIPSKYPCCGTAARFIECASYEWNGKYNNGCCSQILLCPECHHPFYLEFNTLHDYRIYPPRKISALDEIIEKEYPRFAKIYRQSLFAESLNLEELAGMGIRKALESLIKQFVSEQFPDDSAAIESEPLMKTIKRIEDRHIRPLAVASTWIGNDFTHLVAKHPDQNFESLKAFVEAMMSYIVMEKQVEKAIDFTQNQFSRINLRDRPLPQKLSLHRPVPLDHPAWIFFRAGSCG